MKIDYTKFKVDPNGAIGMILTFLAVSTLLTFLIAGIGLIIYGAIVLKSILMMVVLIVGAIALSIMWLDYAD